MKWKKTSEQLPDDYGTYAVKIGGVVLTADWTANSLWYTRSVYSGERVSYKATEVKEWLDEKAGDSWNYTPSKPSFSGWYEVAILFMGEGIFTDSNPETEYLDKVICTAYFDVDKGWRLCSYDNHPFLVFAWKEFEDISSNVPTNFVDIDTF